MIRYYSISYHTIYTIYVIYQLYQCYISFYHHLINVSSWHVMTWSRLERCGPPSPLWCRSQGTASRQLKRWSCWRSGAGGPFLWGGPSMDAGKWKCLVSPLQLLIQICKVRVLTRIWLGSRPHRNWTLEMLELCATPGSGCRQKDCASCKMECNSYTTLHKTIHHATC